MNAGDRLLQRWRIAKVRPFLKPGASVLDIGCADGALFRQVPGLGRRVGVDPDLAPGVALDGCTFLKGLFPAVLPDAQPFDAITLLAVLEHIPADAQTKLAADCAQYLTPGGLVLITVPSPAVDHITEVLTKLHIIHGMDLEGHSGFDVGQTQGIFESAGLRMVKRKRFQLGLNNLFVFRK